jgi:hypothetical protein
MYVCVAATVAAFMYVCMFVYLSCPGSISHDPWPLCSPQVNDAPALKRADVGVAVQGEAAARATGCPRAHRVCMYVCRGDGRCPRCRRHRANPTWPVHHHQRCVS